MPGPTLYVVHQSLIIVRGANQRDIQPYITKTYFGLQKPPVNLAKIAIGDGAIGSFAEFEQLPTVGSLLLSRYYH